MSDLLQIVVFVIVGLSGLAYLFSLVRRDSASETKELASTRGERIDDLEDEVRELRVQLTNVQGALAAYQSLKHEEIAVEVARLLEPRLPRRGDGS